jgi:hypothetical protein
MGGDKNASLGEETLILNEGIGTGNRKITDYLVITHKSAKSGVKYIVNVQPYKRCIT